MTNEDAGDRPEKELPLKPVLNDRAREAGDAEQRAEAVRQDTGAIDADAAHDRSS